MGPFAETMNIKVCAQGPTVVDEWDAWGDEREVQRRKAERKRANLPAAERRTQVRRMQPICSLC